MTNTTNDRGEGSKYDKDLTTTQIAARFREDFKAAQKAGEIGMFTRVSVRTSYYAGGSSITVTVTKCNLQIQQVEYLRHEREQPNVSWMKDRRTPEAVALIKKLEAMLGAYNYDRSDIQTDYFCVNFYGHVGFASELEAAERKEVADKAALDAEWKAATRAPAGPDYAEWAMKGGW